ncbi:MAG: mercury transporter MerT [Nitrospira sp. WS110]|nr:mercury transporter MerT [Nitrospira sp. WS110]
MAVHPYQESTSDREPSNNHVTILSVSGVSAALLASVCCIGPLVFTALGVGVGATGFLAGTAGVLKRLLPYRPAFIGLTILLLGIGFYLTCRNPESARCAPGEVCAQGNPKGGNRTCLWIMASLALVLVLAPYWLGL